MTDPELDQYMMQLAIDASCRALDSGNMPFGAVLAQGPRVVHTSINQQRTALCGRGDITAHAEVVLVREVSERYGLDTLRGATVYASGEPCAMCAGAMFWAGVARVVYGATTPDIIAALGGPELPTRCVDVLGAATPPVVVEGPLLREAAVAVLQATASAGTKR
ncbi:MAG: nucleoside deaminase [Polyangiaceae bacterium]